MFDSSPHAWLTSASCSSSSDDGTVMTCMTDLVFQLLIVFILGVGAVAGMVTIDPGRTPAGIQDAIRGGYVNVFVQGVEDGYVSRVVPVGPGADLMFSAAPEVPMAGDALLLATAVQELSNWVVGAKEADALDPQAHVRVTFEVPSITRFEDGLNAYTRFREELRQAGCELPLYIETITDRGVTDE